MGDPKARAQVEVEAVKGAFIAVPRAAKIEIEVPSQETFVRHAREELQCTPQSSDTVVRWQVDPKKGKGAPIHSPGRDEQGAPIDEDALGHAHNLAG